MIYKRKGLGRERGQAIVEFALAGTLGLTLIFGVIDFGRALFAYDLVANAARIATRYAIVNATPCTADVTGCQAVIANYVVSKSPGIDQTKLAAPKFTWESTSATCPNSYQPGCNVMIEIDYTFAFAMLPLPAQTLKSTSQMVISQ